ncbi:MAG: hypothetical protein IJN03_00975 [Bacilli bacterium]|nr:hypothetical protein [Bacilli bacterium]
MQRDIIELIDTLVKMAGSTSSFDSLTAELDEIKKLISKKEIDLQDLKESMVDEKYFDASGEVVDRNIEISLNKKIKRLNKIAEEIKTEMQGATTLESSLHDGIKDLKSELDSSSKYIDVIEERIDNTASNEIRDNYQELLTIERNNYSTIELKLNEQKEEYEKVEKQIEALSVALNELNDTILKEKEKLAETKASLANPKTYIDEDLKKSDEESLTKLVEEIDELDKKRLSILTDPALIANDVKELVANNDTNESLSKLKELITLVKSKPYMDETNRGTLEATLSNLEKELSDFKAEVEVKKYNGQDSDLLEERINYLKNIIELSKINIDQIRENITIIDTQRVSFIKGKITTAEAQAKVIEKTIEEYHILMNSDEERNEKSKTAIKSTYEKKVKELATVREIINAYKEDLRALIKEAFDAENVEIKAINDKIAEHEEEIARLNKLLVLSSKTKDVIEEEKDKTKIKELTEEIKNIKFCLSFDKTPDEIYDDIEMILGSIGYVENTRTNKYRNEKYTFEKVMPEVKEEPVVIKDDEPLPEPVIEQQLEPVTEVKPVIEEAEEELPIFEEFKENPETNNRLRVVEIIPLDNKEEIKEEDSEGDFNTNGFDDTGYISFEDAVSASNGGN